MAGPTGELKRGIGETQRDSLGREGKLPGRAGEHHSAPRRTDLRPQWSAPAASRYHEGARIDGEYHDLTARNGHHPSSLVGRHEVRRGRLHLDAVQCSPELGDCYAEEDAGDCKSQQQLRECIAPSHRPKMRGYRSKGGTVFVRVAAAIGGPQTRATLGPCVGRLGPRY
jgi:hypothetical protein